ncbi:MAG: hypothetical protein JW836_12740 [Deltaproteobacteria bacterium]|nr:hypothetical protein [Deltaproteobacteria bacterium]
MLKRRYKTAKQLGGVIDLERLRSGPSKCIERDPGLFFDLTYPSEDLQVMLRALCSRFGGREVEGNGLYLAEAVKGLGKSHALLTAYHLFASREPAIKWMKEKGHSWNPPLAPCVIIRKFTDEYLPFDSLWSVVDRELNAGWGHDHSPSLDEFRAALGDRHLILIFDELERGMTNIAYPAKRSQNLTFLQMVTEEANRGGQITVFAAIYDGSVEPGATLKRISPRVEMRFRNPEDRAAIVRHRLFSNADSYDRKAADALIKSYLNAWKLHGVETKDDYQSRIQKTFPFLPDLIELIFERVSGAGGFQGTRGALGLMAAMLEAGPTGSYILTGGHCRLTNKGCANRLQDLDPAGNLINCAQRNHEDLKRQAYAEPMASAVLLASLVPGAKGLTREEIVRHVVTPGGDPNNFESTLQAFRAYGSFFHERERRFFFDLEENESAKVEIEATRISDEKAREEVVSVWKQDLFKETHLAVVFSDAESSRNSLDELPKSTLRFVLAPRRLDRFERHALYYGSEMRNQILLFEPHDETANILANPDILAAAKRSMAASGLLASAASPERRKRYERIATEERGSAKNLIKAAGLDYVRIETWGERPEESVFEMESLGKAYEKQAVQDHLARQYYPLPLLAEHVRENLPSLYGMTVSQVEKVYRNTPGYPVPIMVPSVVQAILSLVEDKDRVLGLQHPRRNFCGEHVTLGHGELPDAILAPPWPAAPSAQTPIPRVSRPEEPPSAAPPVIAATGPNFEEKGTPSCASRGELRQKVAERLSGLAGDAVLSARFQIFVHYTKASLSDIPTALRGSLTGSGDLEAQIDIQIPGPMDKAKAEGLCESLPALSGSTYVARLKVMKEEIGPDGEE